MKKNPKNTSVPLKKQNAIIIVLKIVMIILTVIFSVLMVMLAGAGLIYNGNSYGDRMIRIGVFLIVSGALMTAGTILVCLKKNIVSLICSCSGFALCMLMLKAVVDHADSAGWSDAFTMEPASDMYTARILPVIAPFVLSAVIALIQLFSYDSKEKRRLRKKRKQEKENEPAPPII